MTRHKTPTAAPSSSADVPVSLSPGLQALLSVVLGLHVLAVFLAPLMFASAGSPIVEPLFRVAQPYIDLMYLNHGYFFFAPNPGPNHLVRYELEFADGRKPVVGQFPDRTQQWPRLLYHRHFMLSETMHNLYRPPQGPPEPQRPSEDSSRRVRRIYERDKEQWQQASNEWKEQRAVYESLRKSVGEHLKQEFGASDVVLIRREHRPVYPLELREDRLQLNDEETYRNLPEAPNAEVLPWNPTPSR